MGFDPFNKNKNNGQQQQQQNAGANPPAAGNPPQPPEGNNQNKPPEGDGNKITGAGWRAKVNCTFKGKLVREGDIVPDAEGNPNFERA
jgi:hypothetical protein